MCFMYILSPLNCPIYNIYDTPSPSSPPPPRIDMLLKTLKIQQGIAHVKDN